MKKVFTLGLVMLMVLVGMSTAVAADVTPLIAGGELNMYVPFSNGFTGFCIDRSKIGAQKDIVFEVGSLDIGDDENGIGFSEYLKTLFVEYHNEVFTKHGTNSGYYHPFHASGSNLMLLKVVYGLLDHEGYEASRNTENDYYGANARKVVDLVYAHVNDADYTTPGNTVTLDDGTVAQFDFEILVPKSDDHKDTHQRFFTYKVQYFREITAVEGDEVILSAEINPYAQSGVEVPYVWSKIGSSESITEKSGNLTLNSVSSDDQGRYLCIVTDEANTKTHYYFDLQVTEADAPNNPPNNPPVITSPTTAQEKACVEGENVTLSVTATDEDGDPLTYTWYEQGSETAIGTGSSLTIEECKLSDNGKVYYCVVSDGKDTAASPMFTLKVAGKCVPPMIDGMLNEKKETVDISENGSKKLCTNMTGTGLEYQWYVKNADEDTYQEISGATASEYEVKNVTLADTGKTYRCAATNTCGSATHEFTLNVIKADEGEAPEFITPESNEPVSFKEGEEVVLTAVLKVENADSYQWYVKKPGKEAEVIEGETSNTFRLARCSKQESGNTYYCVAKNEHGEDMSIEFTLKLTGDAPVILSPENELPLTFIVGERVTLSVTAENAATYQWHVDKGDGNPVVIDGAAEPSYTIEKVKAEQNGYRYICVAMNDFGEAGSPAFILNLASVPAMPKTGDDSALYAWIGLLLCAVSCAGLILRKKRVLS